MLTKKKSLICPPKMSTIDLILLIIQLVQSTSDFILLKIQLVIIICHKYLIFHKISQIYCLSKTIAHLILLMNQLIFVICNKNLICQNKSMIYRRSKTLVIRLIYTSMLYKKLRIICPPKLNQTSMRYYNLIKNIE